MAREDEKMADGRGRVDGLVDGLVLVAGGWWWCGGTKRLCCCVLKLDLQFTVYRS